MSRLVLLVFLLALTGLAEADEKTPPVRGRPMTAMAAGVLAKAERIVIGKVAEARTRGGGLQIARIDVQQTLRGVPTKSLTVFVGGPRPTDDRALPSVPYLEVHAKRTSVLFLARRGEGEGEAWKLLTAFAAGGDVGAEKVSALERHVELADIPDPGTRALRTRDFLLEGLKAPGTWTRVHAARELHHLLGAWPAAFDTATIQQLEAVTRKVRLPAQRTWLTDLLKRLECAPPPPKAMPEPPAQAELKQRLREAGKNEDERVEILRVTLERSGARGLPVVLRVVQGESPAVRVRVIDLLAAGGWHEVVGPIRSLYAQEESAEVQRAIVKAVGRLGRQGEVAWLVQRTKSLRVRREALFALARIRTPEARKALEAIRVELRLQEGEAEDFVALIDYLLGGAFDRIERTRGRVPR